MFVIACKFSQKTNCIIQLVKDIRNFHKDEEIVVVDSCSEDKSYFCEVEKLGAIVEDIGNKNYDTGAYWYVFQKYGDRPFFYFLHDSIKIKANLDYLKNNDLTTLFYFNRNIEPFKHKRQEVNTLTNYIYTDDGCGVFGPIFFCKRELMQKMYDKKLYKVLPTNKHESACMEAVFGCVFEQEGYDLIKCSLYGNLFEAESSTGRSGPKQPHTTDWQYPVEKFYLLRQ